MIWLPLLSVCGVRVRANTRIALTAHQQPCALSVRQSAAYVPVQHCPSH